MRASTRALVTRIRGLLDRLAASRRLSNDNQEVAIDEVRAEARILPRGGILDAIDKAIGSNRKRRKEAVWLLAELADLPEAVVRIGQWLNDPNPLSRTCLIQAVEKAGLEQFAQVLNGIIEHDPDRSCREAAIHAAGALRADVNIPVLLRLAPEIASDDVWRLAWALKGYANEACRPCLVSWFADAAQEKQARVIAAWGLGKLGDEQAVAYLVQMLDDPDRKGTNFSAPGQSLRAAQALCDIHGWPFEWDRSYVAQTADRVREAGLAND